MSNLGKELLIAWLVVGIPVMMFCAYGSICTQLEQINKQVFEIKESITQQQTSEDQILWGRNEILSFDINFDSKEAFEISSNAYYYSKIYSVPFPMVMAVINIESGYNTHAISKKGAMGLGQIMPATAEFIASNLGKEEYNLFDIETNIEFSTYYLAHLFDGKKTRNEKDQWPYVLSQYWAGPRTKVHTRYSRKVMKEYKRNISTIVAYSSL